MKPKHPTIPMAAVKSSQIESIGHQGDTLAVKFKSGGVYHYPGVTAGDYNALRNAESILLLRTDTLDAASNTAKSRRRKT